MVLTIIIVLLSLMALMALHEFGHFWPAKKFGVRVDEFGLGFPPRLIGKKIGETIYSLNLLPIGAFVKILGEEEESNDPRSFTQKTLWQRAIILAGGVVSFWIIAYLILIPLLSIWGVPSFLPDDIETGFSNPRVQVLGVLKDSPAKTSGIEAGDIIKTAQFDSLEPVAINKAIDLQNFIEENAGQEVNFEIIRGGEEIEKTVQLKEVSNTDDVSLGISYSRIGEVKYAWYKAPIEAARIVGEKTIEIPKTIAGIIGQLLHGEEVVGAEISGPIGIGKVMARALNQSVGNFLSFIVMFAIWLALFNLLPIPALDGGQLLFLAIEAIRKKPMKRELQQKITAGFFFVLVGIMILVTIKDIVGLF